MLFMSHVCNLTVTSMLLILLEVSVKFCFEMHGARMWLHSLYPQINLQLYTQIQTHSDVNSRVVLTVSPCKSLLFPFNISCDLGSMCSGLPTHKYINVHHTMPPVTIKPKPKLKQISMCAWPTSSVPLDRVQFCNTSSGWFNCNEPFQSTSLQG